MERVSTLKKRFKLKLLMTEWYSVAVRQPKIMLNAYKRLQRRGHHSLSFVAAQYGPYAHYWLRVLLLSWKRLVFDAPGGFLLHREMRLRRNQNFSNAFASSTLLSRAYEVEDKLTQCKLKSQEEEAYEEKMKELKELKESNEVARKEKGEEEEQKEEAEEAHRKLQEELKRQLAQLHAEHADLQKAFEREKRKVADAEKQMQRQQSLTSLKEFARNDMGRMTSELKVLREQTLSYPVSFDAPVVATINNVHQIELGNVQSTKKFIGPLRHRISSCKLAGDYLLAYENKGVLITFHSEGKSNLFVVAGLLANEIERNRTDSTAVTLNVGHSQSTHAQCQISSNRPCFDIAAANHKVEMLLKDSTEEKKSIQALMADEKRANVGHAAEKVEVLSLDQQLALAASEDNQSSSESTEEEKAGGNEVVTMSLDQQLALAGMDVATRVVEETSEGNGEEALAVGLFDRLQTRHRASEVNPALIEEL